MGPCAVTPLEDVLSRWTLVTAHRTQCLPTKVMLASSHPTPQRGRLFQRSQKNRAAVVLDYDTELETDELPDSNIIIFGTKFFAACSAIPYKFHQPANSTTLFLYFDEV